MVGGFYPKKKINAFAVWADILNATEGRFFVVEYRKKDGSIRRLNGRIYEKIDRTKDFQHLIVRDVKLKKGNKSEGGYRKIDPNNILAFRCGSFRLGVFLEQIEANPTGGVNIK